MIKYTVIRIGFIDHALDRAVGFIRDKREFLAGANRPERKYRFCRFDELVDLEILDSFLGKDLTEHVIGLDQQFLEAENAQIPMQVLFTFFCSAIRGGLIAEGSIDGFGDVECEGSSQDKEHRNPVTKEMSLGQWINFVPRYINTLKMSL
jgi:hypothetical protein